MKDSTEYAQLLKKLCNSLKRKKSPPGPLEDLDPITGLILACLSEVTTESKARTALGRIRNNFVDFNELRVSRVEELVEVLGKGFPLAKETSRRILSLLRQIFNKHDNLSLENICEGSKRQAKTYLDSLEDTNSYIVARVMLQSVGAHAFPVHPQMTSMLQKEEVVAPEANEAEIQGFLERQITSSQIRNIYPLLRKHADSFRGKRSKTERTSSAQETKPKTKTKTKTKRKTKKKTR